jgi:hypothetical protein
MSAHPGNRHRHNTPDGKLIKSFSVVCVHETHIHVIAFFSRGNGGTSYIELTVENQILNWGDI